MIHNQQAVPKIWRVLTIVLVLIIFVSLLFSSGCSSPTEPSASTVLNLRKPTAGHVLVNGETAVWDGSGLASYSSDSPGDYVIEYQPPADHSVTFYAFEIYFPYLGSTTDLCFDNPMTVSLTRSELVVAVLFEP